jgi:hypothetical protein
MKKPLQWDIEGNQLEFQAWCNKRVDYQFLKFAISQEHGCHNSVITRQAYNNWWNEEHGNG